MAGIVLEFSYRGDFDSFGIIRSNTPTSLANLPSPLVTGLSTMFYVDTEVVVGQTYYYRTVVWRDGEMMVGDEITIIAGGDQYWSITSSLLHFKNTTLDEKLLNWTQSGNLFFVPNFFEKALAIDTLEKGIYTRDIQFFDFSESFTAEFLAKLKSYQPSSNTGAMITVGGFGTITLYAGFGVNSSGLLIYYEYNDNNSAPFSLVSNTTIGINSSHFYTLEFDKDTSVLRIYLDGNVIASKFISGLPIRPTGQSSCIGHGYSNYFTNFEIAEFRYTKTARYKGDFNPPNTPFPSA